MARPLPREATAILEWVFLVLDVILRLLSDVRVLSSLGFGFHSKSSSSNRNWYWFRNWYWRKPLLPPPRRGLRKAGNELTVVLDLDETLICAYEDSGLPAALHQRALLSGMASFQLQCTVAAADKDRDGKLKKKKTKISHVTVYERPGLRDFLSQASRFAELVIFTAGLEGYAKPLVDKIDPENRISARLYRPSTIVTKYREHVKDLSRLGRDLRRTVIVDNNPCSFMLQPLNGIPCVSFTAEDPQDKQLLEVILPLLQTLASAEDVRPVLHERFQMDSWFRSRGL